MRHARAYALAGFAALVAGAVAFAQTLEVLALGGDLNHRGIDFKKVKRPTRFHVGCQGASTHAKHTNI